MVEFFTNTDKTAQIGKQPPGRIFCASIMASHARPIEIWGQEWFGCCQLNTWLLMVWGGAGHGVRFVSLSQYHFGYWFMVLPY